MSKKISYKGQLGMGEQEKIKLSTPNGKRGYKVTKFEVIPSTPGVTSAEQICKLYTKKQTTITSSVDFTESDLVGVAYYANVNTASSLTSNHETIVFDNEVFNQDVYVTAEDALSGSLPLNYYIEMETVKLSDIQSTQLTLKNLRAIASR
jgi:hypothetical protein